MVPRLTVCGDMGGRNPVSAIKRTGGADGAAPSRGGYSGLPHAAIPRILSGTDEREQACTHRRCPNAGTLPETLPAARLPDPAAVRPAPGKIPPFFLHNP